MNAVTRRAALSVLFAAGPLTALAAGRKRLDGAPGRILVDVSPLRRNGDVLNADYLAAVLPGFLRQNFGPGHDVRVRIDSVSYGIPGSNGQSNGNGAVDSIEGVGWIDGRETPLFCALQTTVGLPDIGDYQAHQRQYMLALAFAQWLPRQAGL
jgi:hypothetical protein